MTCFKGFCGSLHFFASFFRGPERLRTAVGAFAELCLATRPQDRKLFLFISSAFALPIRQLADTGPINFRFSSDKYRNKILDLSIRTPMENPKAAKDTFFGRLFYSEK
jgi:hypothetical protein